jgi:hypothetical protein
MQTSLVCSYSRTITGWLINKFPGNVSLDSSGADYEEIISVLQLLVPAIEFQATTQGKFNLSGRIKEISGYNSKKEQLKWLIDAFKHSDLPEPVKDELYSQLKVFVKWKLDPEHIARTYLQLPFANQWVQGKTIKSIQANRLIREKIDLPARLSVEQKSFLLDAMKISLAMNYRETDPVTFADESEIELFEMGRGLQIALVGMQANKRLSLESYIGYMAFRNGLPIAYGGGWIWGQRCRIGISIYPEYRKVESAWLFTQVLRLYYQYFNARHFIIRPNQFGKDNRDGLKSGAFWFFFKLGFRPVHNELRKLAFSEWKKLRADKTYRSSLKTLQSFTAGPLEWKLNRTTSLMVDAETISRKISEMINTDYEGSRLKARRSIKNQVSKKLKPIRLPRQLTMNTENFENWCLLIHLIPEFQHWDRKNKKDLIGLMQLKQTGKEKDFIVGMQKLRVFWRSALFLLLFYLNLPGA